MSSKRVVAIIPAAGIGSRMQADCPKQYLHINGKTILEHTVEKLLGHTDITRVVIALHPNDTLFNALSIANHANVHTVIGGEERADSVLNALHTLADDEWALVHDAARPCVDRADIDNLLQVSEDKQFAGGILATPVRDTMKRAEVGSITIAHTETRVDLWHALTPQLFPAGLLKRALLASLTNGLSITDEASAMEQQGYKVKLISANPANIKVTHPHDLALASYYLSAEQLTTQ